MLRIGCHLSSAKGYCSMAKDAAKIHANTFSFSHATPAEEMPKKSILKM